MKINNIGIIGIGSYVPEKILTNEDIDLLGNDTNSDWTKEKLGIEERRIVENELPSDLAYHASIEAINLIQKFQGLNLLLISYLKFISRQKFQ